MKIEELPFVRQRENGTVDTWCPNKTGDYETDWKHGKNHFTTLISKSPSAAQVAHIVHAIVEKGELSGVEVGFIHSMSVFAVT